MLQSKQISKLLSEGLTPINTSPETSAFAPSIQINNTPLSISLLSSDGIALTTVVNSTLLNELDLSSDNLKIYSLIGYNYLHQQLQQFYKKYYQTSIDQPPPEINLQEEELVSWTIIELENNLKLIIQKLTTDAKHSPPLYIILFYHNQFPNEIAKLKSDNLKQALNQGLKGYTN